MTFRKFKKVIKNYFIVTDKNLAKNKYVYYSGYVYLKCDNSIRFEVRYWRKKKEITIEVLSFTRTDFYIKEKRLETAIEKLYEAVIDEYKSSVEYWKDNYNNKRTKPNQEEKEV